MLMLDTLFYVHVGPSSALGPTLNYFPTPTLPIPFSAHVIASFYPFIRVFSDHLSGWQATALKSPNICPASEHKNLPSCTSHLLLNLRLSLTHLLLRPLYRGIGDFFTHTNRHTHTHARTHTRARVGTRALKQLANLNTHCTHARL